MHVFTTGATGSAVVREIQRPGPGRAGPGTVMAGMDVPADDTLTREATGWAPTHRSLLEGLDEAFCFQR